MQQPAQTGPFNLEAQMKLMRIVWFALIFSVFVLGHLVYNMPPPAEPPPTIDHSIQINMFGGVSVLMAIMSFVLPGLIMNGRLRVKLPPSSDPTRNAYSTYFMAWIVGQALRESIATLGFVTAITTHNKDYFAYFAVASMVLQFIGMPQIAKVRELEQKLRMHG